jgi:hypothetical protein
MVVGGFVTSTPLSCQHVHAAWLYTNINDLTQSECGTSSELTTTTLSTVVHHRQWGPAKVHPSPYCAPYAPTTKMYETF